jgi:5-(carboxyamino)imidazole ribonucleotide synthase
LLAVEMFLTEDNAILVNEVAPRPHNSAHYSIEACSSSQFDQHINAILDLPLGCSKSYVYAIMANLVGSEGSVGQVIYQGIEEAMKIDNVKIHLYGKQQTKPNRKMGHVTITDTDLEEGLEKIKKVKKLIQIKTK